MNFLDIVLWSWYKILDKTIYTSGTESGDFGPREHSFLITFLFHATNLWTIFRFFTVKYFGVNMPFYLSTGLLISIYATGYLIYFKWGRLNKVITFTTTTTKTILYVFLGIVYAIVSVYLMFQATDYVRENIVAR